MSSSINYNGQLEIYTDERQIADSDDRRGNYQEEPLEKYPEERQKGYPEERQENFEEERQERNQEWEQNNYESLLKRRLDRCLLKDPNLSEAQVKVILQSFSVLDENGDGRISRREVARAYRVAGFNPTKTEIEEIIQQHDVNADGYIDFEEYFNVMKGKLIKLDFEKDRMKTAFKVIDTDQDGFITVEELEHALTVKGDRFTDKEVAEIIRKADKNNDGKIDYEEFVEAELCKTVF